MLLQMIIEEAAWEKWIDAIKRGNAQRLLLWRTVLSEHAGNRAKRIYEGNM